MSNIGFALQFDPAAYAQCGSLERQFQYVRELRFDYLVWMGTQAPAPEEIRRAQQATRTRIIAAQLPHAHLLAQPESTCRYWQELGVPDIIVADATPDGLDALAEAAERHKLRLSCLLPAPIPYDLLPAHHACAAVDVGRATRAGEDPVALIRRFADSSPLVILHDVATGKDGPFTGLGTGIHDWEKILDAGEEAAAEWYVVGAGSVDPRNPDALRAAYEFLTQNA